MNGGVPGAQKKRGGAALAQGKNRWEGMEVDGPGEKKKLVGSVGGAKGVR